MSSITIAQIRPVSWKIVVPGESEAKYVRHLLIENGLQTSEPQRDTTSVEQPMYYIIANSKQETTTVAPELEAILSQDKQIDLAFSN